MKTFLALLIFCMSSLAQETWNPDKNPASLTRLISSFTEPSAFLEIKAEYPGKLETFDIMEGKALEGDSEKVLIAVQDSKLAAIEVERAKAALKSEEKMLVKKQSEKKIMEREVAYRLLEVKRLETLAKEGKVTKSSFDRTKFDYDSSLLKIADIDNAILVQTQALELHKVAIAKAEEDLRRYKIYGPKGWVLNERLIEPGSWINAGERIAQLVDVRTLSIFFRLNEEEVEALEMEKVQLKVKRTQNILPIKLHRMDLAFDPVSRKRLVEFRVDTSQVKISTGTKVELSLEVPYPKPAVKIPSSFVFKKFEQDYVKSSDGEDIALIPLRKTKDSIIINRSVLPDKITLVKPKK